MSDDKKYFIGIWIIALLLLAVGTVWILDNTGIVNFGVNNWWPLLLIAIGVLYLVFHRRLLSPGGWLLILLGVVSFLAANNILERKEIWEYWPVILIFMGIFTVLERIFRPGKEPSEPEPEEKDDSHIIPPGDDRIQGASVFGGITRKISSRAFKGGSINTVFGGAYINLRPAHLFKEGGVLDLYATFGGITIRLPKEWPIEIRPTVVLGGVTSRNSNNEKTSGRRLIINANATLGGITIIN